VRPPIFINKVVARSVSGVNHRGINAGKLQSASAVNPAFGEFCRFP
jgi:hypothetical protein